MTSNLKSSELMGYSTVKTISWEILDASGEKADIKACSHNERHSTQVEEKHS